MSTLSQSSSPGEEQPADLSPWWLRSIGIVLIVGFAVLLYITWEGYQKAPPIPDRVVATDGTELFTKADVGAGQSVFLKYGLMNNGTIWGHGAMIGPDFSADALHRIGLDTASALARQQFNQDYETLNPQQKAAVEAQVAVVLKENRYDAATGVLTLTEPEAQAWSRQPAYWAEYFSHPRNNGGLKAGVNFQAGQFVYGLEADFEKTNIAGHFVDSGIGRGDDDIQWQSSIRARMGLAADRFMIYGTGGIAFASIKNTYTFLPTMVSESFTNVTHGYTVGLGVDMAITDNVIGGLEFRHTEFADKTNISTVAFPGLTGKQEPSSNAIRLSISYKF